jgi:dihydrofolate reductase
MRKLFVTQFLTLDGVAEAPGGEPGHPHSGWVFDYVSPEFMQFKLDELLRTESLLIGRVTYESFAGAWPDREGPMSDKMNAMHKDVVSTTLKDPAWNNCSVIADDIAGQVRRLKSSPGGPIGVHGSRTLVHTLMEHDLVDEFHLMVFPVVLGSGFKLFPDSPRKWSFKLTRTEPLPNGVCVNTYAPA